MNIVANFKNYVTIMIQNKNDSINFILQHGRGSIWCFRISIFVKIMSRLLYDTMHQVMWYFWVFIVNPFSLLWMIFSSRKLRFLWFPYLLLIDESISLDTSGKPTVGFFLKITSPSWIILSISLDELNSIDWLLKSWWWIFLK